jgi:hypothetical protein
MVAASYGNVLAETIGERAGRGDLVIFTASTRPTTEYYLGAFAARLRLTSYPMSSDEHLGWIDFRIGSDPAFAAEEAARLGSWMDALDPAPGTIWLVEPRSRGNAPLVEALTIRGWAIDATRSTDHVLSFRKS